MERSAQVPPVMHDNGQIYLIIVSWGIPFLIAWNCSSSWRAVHWCGKLGAERESEGAQVWCVLGARYPFRGLSLFARLYGLDVAENGLLAGYDISLMGRAVRAKPRVVDHYEIHYKVFYIFLELRPHQDRACFSA